MILRPIANDSDVTGNERMLTVDAYGVNGGGGNQLKPESHLLLRINLTKITQIYQASNYPEEAQKPVFSGEGQRGGVAKRRALVR